jgi:uroporphyrinogen III methyltransferase/synthase
VSSLVNVSGKIYLVGAGPGDPGLLTLRGKNCLEQADVILYDYLANPRLLDLAPPSAQRIYVGRRGRGAYQEQQEVNDLMIEHARAGRTVVRLKGGDPFIFGRGGEEAEAISAAGLPFEVVPGVTSAVAVPAYAGIPVTHRTMASTVAFVTGHEDAAKEDTALEWPRLATAEGTLVFLMAMKNLPHIVRRLLAEGRVADTPVAAIRWGTRPNQRTVVGTLGTIVEQVRSEELGPPSVIVVGDVVRLRERLNWFETRPLFGKRILVTRPRDQASELSARLSIYGAEPVEIPTIEIVPPEDWTEMDGAIKELHRYQWLVFTSVNGIAPFMERLRHHQRDARALWGLRLCCIGPRTADELNRYGLRADVIPKEEYQAEGLIEAMTGAGVAGQGVLIARAAAARELLPDQLRNLGCEVRIVAAYRTVRPADKDTQLRERFREGAIDMVTFTSSSTVVNFAQWFDSPADMQQLLKGVMIACIGPITAKTARDHGLAVAIVPAENTVPSLTDAIVRFVSKPS